MHQIKKEENDSEREERQARHHDHHDVSRDRHLAFVEQHLLL